MGKNRRIAKSLVRLARMLVAVNRQRLEFYDFNNFLEENGWAFYDSVDVKGPRGTGVRYSISPYVPEYKKNLVPISSDEMENKLNNMKQKYSNVIFSKGVHQYAPEMSCLSVILLD